MTVRVTQARLTVLLERIMAMSDVEVADTLVDACRLFADRHIGFDAVLDPHYDAIADRFAALLSSAGRSRPGAVEALDNDGIDRPLSGETTRFLHWLASSNYRVSFPSSSEISERVLFPSGPTESHGMEDARFVRFVDDDDGSITYYSTYTAFDGHQILPQLIGRLLHQCQSRESP